MKPWSLRWRLVRYLVVLQVTASVLGLVGFVALYWATGRFVDEGGEATTSIVGAAIQHSSSGQLTFHNDEESRWLIRASPELWFIARDMKGHELRYGNVPQRYVNVIKVLDGMERAALDLAEASARPAARFERIQTTQGPVNLIVKTGSPYSAKNKIIRWALVFIVLVAPTMLVTLLVVVAATPFVVRRGLRSVETIAAEMENVNIETLGTRLPTREVPTEVLPLVEAVNRAFDRLNEGYRRRARFLADAAHELRTPITTLRIQADTLPNTEHKAPLIRAAIRLTTLAEQLLGVQRLECMNAVTQKVDLRVICEAVAADLAPLAIMSDCSIAVEASHSIIIRADASALERAVSNLVQNAIDHGGQGGEIQILVQQPGCIIVNDSGPGIPPSERERVVEPFYRARANGRGAGLGLYLVAEVAQMHGGRLIVGESPTGGASIRMDLDHIRDSHLLDI
jgi:signal transduction histidine kinase